MENEAIVKAIAENTEKIKSNEFRLDALEKSQEEMFELIRSVDKLAVSVQAMAKEQTRQGQQLDALERSKFETFKYWFRTILTAVATGLIGYALATFIK